MKHGMICQDCGKTFSGHGNRTRCKPCQIANNEWVLEQREEFDQVKGQAKHRDRKQCTQCGAKENLTVHHITHLVDGGSNELSNLTTLCFACHMKAHHG